MHVADARAPRDLRADLVERFGAASVLFVPIAWGGEVRHVAIAVFRERRELSDDEIALAPALADQTAAGLARLEAERARRPRARQDEALVRAARALNASLELDEVLRTLAREAAQAVAAEMSGVYLGNAETGGWPRPATTWPTPGTGSRSRPARAPRAGCWPPGARS